MASPPSHSLSPLSRDPSLALSLPLSLSPDAFLASPSPAVDSPVDSLSHSTPLSLSAISHALPSPCSHSHPTGHGGFSFHPEAVEMEDAPQYASPIERAPEGIFRSEAYSGAEPMLDEPPPSVPSSPTYFDSMTSGAFSRERETGESGFLTRTNSFDSTAATLGSPRPSMSGLESPFPTSTSTSTSTSVRRQSLIVMRHSERLDDVDPLWVASSERPWDPPITERGKEIAFEVGRRVRSEAWEISRLVVSPFLRCVQTAAEVLRALTAVPLQGTEGSRTELKVDPTQIKVYIDYGLGEMMNRRAMRDSVSLKGKGVEGEVWLLPQAELESLLPPSLLDKEAVPTMTKLPAYPESDEAAHVRFSRTFDALADKHMEEDVLCITHGEGVSVSVSRLLPVTVYEVNYCGFSWAQRPVYGGGGGEEGDSRPVGEWELLTDSGVTGISWLHQ